MWLNIILNVGILALFKYYDFFITEFARLFHFSADGLLLKVILPVGISFYTFQALSYTIDVYRGKLEPTKDIVAFFAFISFFPQLVAGPIERATNLLPQFQNKRKFNYDTAMDGTRQILWGLFKKLLVANNCSAVVDATYFLFNRTIMPGSELLLTAILFTFQIYADFSGYSDIAIGTAKLFGIRLTRNFNNPYFSRNMAEFWRKWHISLMSWFRDYIYIPLGGNRINKRKTIRNILIVFAISGLWHGANWTYLVWGLYHAFLLIIGVLSSNVWLDYFPFRQSYNICTIYSKLMSNRYSTSFISFLCPTRHLAEICLYHYYDDGRMGAKEQGAWFGIE